LSSEDEGEDDDADDDADEDDDADDDADEDEDDAPSPPPQLASLEALVREGKADVNARDEHGRTPLNWVTDASGDKAAAVDLLVRLGADVNARDNGGQTPLILCARWYNLATLRRLLGHGASPDLVDNDGFAPLIMVRWYNYGEDATNLALELVRRSSPATRRAVAPPSPGSLPAGAVGMSAVDFVVSCRPDELYQSPHFEAWDRQLIEELLAAGAPVLPKNAPAVLPIAVALSARQEAELAARRSESRRWRAHDDLVDLALDFGELREAKSEVEDK
jgi:ankyrin repeat protein